jgi:membrane protein YqaA with SNARE-associated domain
MSSINIGQGCLNLSIKQRVQKLIYSKKMLTGIGIASFLESTVVPIPLETLLIPLMQKRREKLWLIAAITTLGCLAGALLGYAVGYYLFDLVRDWVMNNLTSEKQFSQFKASMDQEGFWFVFSTGVTPVPLQIAMLVAGVTKYSLLMYMFAVTLSRSIRYFGLALLVYYFGDKTEDVVRKHKWKVVIGGIAVLVIFLVIRFWL